MRKNRFRHIPARWRNPATAGLLTFLLFAAVEYTAVARGQDLLGWDFRHFAFYMHVLQQSSNPAEQAIVQQIARGPADLARQKELAHRENLPLDLSNLQAAMPPPDQNAAPLYLQIKALPETRQIRLPSYANPPSADFTYSLQQVAAIKQILRQHQDTLRLIHRAVDRPRCIFAHDWSLVAANPGGNLSSLMTAARVLKTEAYLDARSGRYSDAVHDSVRGLHVADHTGAAPTLIAYLFANLNERRALQGMADTLLLAGPSAEVDHSVQQAITNHRPNLSLRDGLRGELAFAMSSFAETRRKGPDSLADDMQSGSSSLDSRKPQQLSKADHQLFLQLVDAQTAYHIRRMREMIEASVLPSAARRAAFRQFADPHPGNPITTLSDLSLSVLSVAAQKEDQLRASEEVVLAGAAVLEARAETGQFPVQLPGHFIDPFSGRPMQYRREGAAAFVVYSVGPDGRFDGGKPGVPPTRTQILFRFPLRPVAAPTDEHAPG